MPQLKIDLVVNDKGSLVLAGFGTKVDRVMWSGRDAVKRLGSELAIAGAGMAAIAGTVGMLGRSFIQVADEAGRLEASLDTITKGEGAEWFERLNDWALKMPVNTNEAIKTFQMLSSMGLKPTIEDMTTLVDTSAAMGGQAGTLEGIARALGQIQTKGKVSAEELMQLAERGIPAYEILQEKLGLTRDQLGNIGNAGIDANEAVQALLEGMSERYGGLSEKLNKMWSGQIETVRSYAREFQRLVMKSGPMGELESGLDGIIKKLDQWKDDGSLKEWADTTGRYIVDLKTNMVGIGKDILPYLEGIGTAAAGIYNTAKSLSELGGPSTGEWGLIGYILLRGGPQAAALAAALITVNDAAGKYGHGLGDLRRSLNETVDASNNFFDSLVQVANGERDWNTGAWAEDTVGAMLEALEKGKPAIEQKFKEISDATGVPVVSMDELKKAVADGLLHFDDLTAGWVAGAKEMSDAVSESAGEQEKITSARLKEMEDAYKKYVDAVKKFQDEIAGRERSLAAELRAMSRTGMDDMSAWRDRKKEAEEYYAAAQKAAEAGEFDQAVKYADEARQMFKSLNEEVRDGEQVLLAGPEALAQAMDGVKMAGKLAIDILEGQKKAAQEAADALDDESGGKLSGKLDEAKASLLDLDRTIKDSGGDWGQVWDEMERNAKKSIQEVDREIIKLVGDRYVNIKVLITEQRSSGGPVGRYADGGLASFPRLSSPLITAGGGFEDDVPALLKRREFVMRPEATDFYGVDFMHDVNSLQFRRGIPVRASSGGAIGNLGDLVTRAVSPARFSGGGLVMPQPPAASVSDDVTVNFTFPSGRSVGPFRGPRAVIRELDRERRHMELGGSAV